MKNTEQIIQELESRISNLENYIEGIKPLANLDPSLNKSLEDIKINYLLELRDLLDWIKE